MSDFVLYTPVAFFIFNRPDVTSRVFREITKSKPKELLIVGDGARSKRPGEQQQVAAARAVVEAVNWECEIHTNFSDVNMGCKNRVSSGIDWVFSLVETAIILEDDCLPEPSFFQFCQEMLDRYKYDQRVGLISGDNFQFGRMYGEDSYYFSKCVHIWGWATWRDRWVDSYDVLMSDWPSIKNSGRVVDLVGSQQNLLFWTDIFQRVHDGKIDTWDYQWVFATWMQGRSCILPCANLISNIGFGANATHTFGESVLANMTTSPIAFPLKHPRAMFINSTADHYSNQRFMSPKLWKRIVKKLLRHIK